MFPENNEEICFEEEQTCFKKKFIRKFYKIKKKVDTPYDIISEIKNGKLDEILTNNLQFGDFVQIDLEIESEKVTDKGEIKVGVFKK